MVKVKGTGWLSIREYFVKTFGEEKLAWVLGQLSAEDQTVMSKMILPSSWIEYGAAVRAMLKADELLGCGDKQLVARANEYSARKDFGGIYKLLLNFVSPNLLFEKTATAWRQFYDSGDAKIEKISDTSVRLVVTELPDMPKGHEYETVPYMLEMLRMAKAKNPQGKHSQCVGRGDDRCVWEFSWDK